MTLAYTDLGQDLSILSGEWYRLIALSPVCETCLFVGTGAFIDGDAIRIEI